MRPSHSLLRNTSGLQMFMSSSRVQTIAFSMHQRRFYALDQATAQAVHQQQQQQAAAARSAAMRTAPGSSVQNLMNTEYTRRLNSSGIIAIVPHAERWVVERLGRYSRTLEPGIHFLIPILDKIAYKHLTKEIPVDIAEQSAVTRDNVQVVISGVLYFRVNDPFKASYEIEQPLRAIVNLAQTTMRAEIGKITLDRTFSERQNLNISIVEQIQLACEGWGLSVQRYEIKDILVPPQIQLAMDLEAEAERKKRKAILDSEAERQSVENIAAGRKRATELTSEADMVESINLAKGEAFAISAKATAMKEAITQLAEAIQQPGGEQAVAFRVAQDYIQAFGKLAQQGNTIIVPANVNDASAQVAQAVTLFDRIFNKNKEMGSSMTKQQALEALTTELNLSATGEQNAAKIQEHLARKEQQQQPLQRSTAPTAAKQRKME